MQTIKVKLIHPAAKSPTRMTEGSAGFDLYAAETMEVPATRCTADGYADIGRALVPTGLQLELPLGTVGRVGSRSGLSIRSNVEVGAGWIDSDYRGELLVELKNLSSIPYRINRGDRIAQLIILPLEAAQISVVAELNNSGREAAGFGSTGV